MLLMARWSSWDAVPVDLHDGDDGSAVVMPSGGRSAETYGGL